MKCCLWTRDAVRQLIKEKYDIDMPIRTVGMYLQRWGFTVQRPEKKRTGLVWSILSLITWVILVFMLRCCAVYLTNMYGATGGAKAMALPLPYCYAFTLGSVDPP